MGFQIPLLVIDRRGVTIMSGVIPNRRVAHLRVGDGFIKIGYKEKNRRTSEVFRDISDDDRSATE